MVKFNENAIREAAYYNWQNAGCPQGQDEKFWMMAVEQLSSCNSSCSKSSCSKSSSSKSSATKSCSSKSASCKSASAKKAAAPKKSAK